MDASPEEARLLFHKWTEAATPVRVRILDSLVIFDGVGVPRIIASLLWLGRFSLLTAVLAGLGRAVAEVGAILIVGGNIAGVTRTMTTAITLETSRGDLGLALGLGIILVTLMLFINATAHVIGAVARRAAA